MDFLFLSRSKAGNCRNSTISFTGVVKFVFSSIGGAVQLRHEVILCDTRLFLRGFNSSVSTSPFHWLMFVTREQAEEKV